MSTNSIPGFISKPSPHSVPETIQRLCAFLKSKVSRFLRSSITVAKPKKLA